MSEPVILSAAMLLGVTIVAIAMLQGWQGWLRFKERELERVVSPQRDPDGGSAVGAARKARIIHPSVANATSE